MARDSVYKEVKNTTITNKQEAVFTIYIYVKYNNKIKSYNSLMEWHNYINFAFRTMQDLLKYCGSQKEILGTKRLK